MISVMYTGRGLDYVSSRIINKDSELKPPTNALLFALKVNI